MAPTGIGYRPVDKDYFSRRGLRRYAGVASLWALGVGAVISGHYSGWNLGLLAGGWGGFALVTLAIAVVTLVFQLLDPIFAAGVFWVGVWFTLGIIWFALVGQHRLVLAPEEAFATGASESD